ncbi:Hypothetical protein PP7435_CHR2-0779 [Komagataella phaffii CBS 7435]|uniref:Uncharacterized protein n=1 Tax=Komagataella phaffii (strain ATCC 76273 / CBS 7435 / CECT 11047 / NRRL Y-11430 / Wegner 21-1) TaxID=981350 RepID=F2QST6_KOMPC|nr:GQ67_00562T0 [Komagataella phaffii]AOA67023.1 GQ68_00826T0 [Komagataella phaffii GS115]CAH2448332.1 Hypothetical protein BQ9382_C2-4200 [Komagataella phaffii CBS 7435]CCA38464.1 Hypothetical protein PP7435_CHR2-0779 [Komagataella phaffii CBS 7435]
MSAQSTTAKLLYNSSHSVLNLQPLSHKYGRKFHAFLETEGLKTEQKDPDEFSTKYCKHCHNLFIPGLTCSIRIVYKKSAERNRKRKRELTHECLNCGFIRPYAILQEQPKLEIEDEDDDEPKQHKLSLLSSKTGSMKKKKKLSNLEEMLQAKRQAERKKSLSLKEFMQNF